MQRMAHWQRWTLFLGTCIFVWTSAAEEILQAPQEEPSTGISELGSTTTLAQNTRRRRTKKRSRRRGGSSSSSAGESSRASVVSNGLKAGAGLVLGAEGDTPFILGADYTLPIGYPNLLLDFGGSYWSYSVQSASVTVISIEGGVDYHFPITASGKLVGGARLTYVNASGGGASDSKFGLTVLGGYEHNLGGAAFGAELRHPMVSDLDVNYLMGYYKFIF